MLNFFQKALVITDMHFGRNSNSPVANQDNLDFLDWAIDRAKSWGAETCIFMGDWHDNRHSIHISTLDFSIRGVDKINKAFEHVFWVRGNHDEYQRDYRGITSVGFIEHISNIKLINDITTVGDVTFLPWLTKDEMKDLGNVKSRYVFGHLEMSGFLLNSRVTMPDGDDILKADTFDGPEYVFTGHFHARQLQSHKTKHGSTNIFYTGNVMPFNFSDANDSDRGLMLLEWGKEPILEAWPDQPLYRTMQLSTLLQDEGKILKPKMSIKVEDNISMSYEESQEIKEMMTKAYDLRKFEILRSEKEENQEFEKETDFKDVDQLFVEGLLSVTSNGLSNEKLVKIYNDLKTL